LGLFNKLQFWKHDDFASPSEQPAPDFNMQNFDPLQSQPLEHTDPFQAHDPSPGQYPMQSSPFQSMPQQQSQSYPASTPFPGTAQSVPQHYEEKDPVHPRDIELILAKLDAIKSEMDALHQRIRKIEQATENRKYW
jgi:hypothetical protein